MDRRTAVRRAEIQKVQSNLRVYRLSHFRSSKLQRLTNRPLPKPHCAPSRSRFGASGTKKRLLPRRKPHRLPLYEYSPSVAQVRRLPFSEAENISVAAKLRIHVAYDVKT
ncbi:hypothetical protein KM043_015307 [Ampulex compressa]|nr:hypothetical protein KM043_015307 [Ampulex compressa]